MPGSQAVEALREKVDGYLRETPLDVSVDDQGDFMIRSPQGSSIVWVRPVDWEDGRTLVRIWAITNVGVRTDGDLAKFLVTTNAKWPVGGFRLDERGPAVILAHSLLGEYLNRVEIMFAVAAVVAGADKYAGEIKEQFGGRLFSES